MAVMNLYLVLMLLFLVSTYNVCTAGPQTTLNIEGLNLKVGMKRSVLEQNISKYVELKSDYSAQYPAESATEVIYTMGAINLTVKYKQGMPAPYIKNKDGSISHLEAIEQTVLTWVINE